MADIKVLVHPEDWPGSHDVRDHVIGGIERRNLNGCFDSIERRCVVPTVNDDEAPTRERLRILTARELENAKPLEFRLAGVIPDKSVVVAYGPPSCGKSLWTHGVSVALASDTPAYGRAVKGGPVLLVAAEGIGGLPARLRAAMSVLDEVPRQRALDRLHIICDTPALHLTHPNSDTDAVLRAADQLPEPPALAVFDTLHRVIPGGDDNSSQDIGGFMRNVDRFRDRLGCAVLILHHCGKVGGDARGSSAIRGAADVMMSLKLTSGILTIEVDKARDFEPPKPMTLRLVPEGDSVRLEAVDHQGFVAKAQGAMVLAVIRKAGGWVSLQKIKHGCPGKSGITVERYVGELFKASAIEQRRVGKSVEYRVKPKAGGAA